MNYFVLAMGSAVYESVKGAVQFSDGVSSVNAARTRHASCDSGF